MYKIIENPQIMTKEDIDKMFDGKWIYIVKADITKHGELIKGMPVIIADEPYEGTEDGIYDKYNTYEFVKRCDYNLIHYEPFIPSVFAVEFV